MTGKKTLPLTYDPFFKKMFNPDSKAGRLSDFISTIIGQKVTVEAVLPSEDIVLSVDSLLIMDILVRLKDGSIANVEIQKIPYDFPAERISCYSADLLLRQYTRLKMNENFKYSDLKKVYTIIIYEKTISEFHESYLEGAYFHKGKTCFETGLNLEFLQEYYLIALDVFKEKQCVKGEDRLDMWLSLLTTENMDDVDVLIEKYPELEAIFFDMSQYITKPEEVMGMFSEALKIMDRNTVRYMMDNLTEKLSDAETKLSDAETKLSDIETKLITMIIEITKEKSGTREDAIKRIITDCGKNEDDARDIVDRFW